MRIIVVFILFFIQSLMPLQAQLVDSLLINVGTAVTIASKDHQPLWIVSNRFASISDQRSDLSTHILLSNQHVARISKKTALKDSIRNTRSKGLYLSYGFDIYNNNKFNDFFIQEGYIKAGFRNWEIRAGRYKEIIGEVDQDLSSGSILISGNALPITKAGIAVTKYTNVPFTNGWLQYKGNISQGWMGDDRYLKKALFHEKSFYMRVGKKKLKLFGGMAHFAEWGGIRPPWKLDRSWKAFWDVLLIKQSDDGTTGGPGSPILPNRQGDQRGGIEAGLDWENDKIIIHAYQQTPFESGLGIDIRNIDRLMGLSITSKRPGSKFIKVLAEFIHTKQMMDYHQVGVRDSYYNNGFYATGWEYENRIIGTPLFVNRHRASHYFPEVKPYDWNGPDNTIFGNSNIIINRIVGGHLGLLYAFNKKLVSKSLLTFTRNLDGYQGSGIARLESPLNQWYSLEEITYSLRNAGLSLTASAAVDWGDLTNNTGLMLGVQWKFQNFGRSHK